MMIYRQNKTNKNNEIRYITMSQYSEEIERRRTFAIISHPDAGKTTLTENCCSLGGHSCGRSRKV